jgi:hypothetical protein
MLSLSFIDRERTAEAVVQAVASNAARADEAIRRGSTTASPRRSGRASVGGVRTGDKVRAARSP